ncbi:MAG: rRNA pseudouridine synthase [Proteobacteria bacterium]|nr:rRNA pseudouridine synthase [Pseudomonadota bacterium]MBU4259671.1 rRNA pseudouridine synthase [Pseudomonadota bacterium]MBU4388414.1 rRNA pseudouridine synthase [Pseudomonadota bacterium]
MPLMRLQKFLSSTGFCSRRKAEEYIKDGHVKVNGEVVSELGTKIEPAIDLVEVNGKLVEAKHDLIYIALNKPQGYVASCSQKGDKIVLDLINIQDRVYPIGRLDKDSTGLLILTNDGELHHRLSHPSFDHEKEYEVAVVKPISDGALRKMAKGMPMMGTKTRPADVKRISSCVFYIVLKEGKNKQIRRMVRKMGNNVVRLKRIRISNIKLGNLSEGSWRYLTEKEKQELKLPRFTVIRQQF